jgi:hypothetical protein
MAYLLHHKLVSPVVQQTKPDVENPDAACNASDDDASDFGSEFEVVLHPGLKLTPKSATPKPKSSKKKIPIPSEKKTRPTTKKNYTETSSSSTADSGDDDDQSDDESIRQDALDDIIAATPATKDIK